jgi:hypothetical protein
MRKIAIAALVIALPGPLKADPWFYSYVPATTTWHVTDIGSPPSDAYGILLKQAGATPETFSPPQTYTLPDGSTVSGWALTDQNPGDPTFAPYTITSLMKEIDTVNASIASPTGLLILQYNAPWGISGNSSGSVQFDAGPLVPIIGGFNDATDAASYLSIINNDITEKDLANLALFAVGLATMESNLDKASMILAAIEIANGGVGNAIVDVGDQAVDDAMATLQQSAFDALNAAIGKALYNAGVGSIFGPDPPGDTEGPDDLDALSDGIFPPGYGGSIVEGAAVPESSTWAMMLLGLMLLGYRRSRYA